MSEKHEGWLWGFVIGAALVLAAIFFNTPTTDYNRDVANLISCADHSEAFLSYLGYSSRDACVQMNWALHEQASEECDDRMGRIGSLDKDIYMELHSQCVYHQLESEIGTITNKAWADYVRETSGD